MKSFIESLAFFAITIPIHFLAAGGIATLLGFQSLYDFACVFSGYVIFSYLIFCFIEDLKKMANAEELEESLSNMLEKRGK